jgi:hypothetical protein
MLRAEMGEPFANGFNPIPQTLIRIRRARLPVA